ncbi:SEC-C metal-binding domain-containing protein [Brevibacillus sp. H7]|uniref:SEC-C metal-binding domain-containing protein n=1 Tax=Brevibacillus sp. H7 TaxID=3349138 RepID=UPI003810F431
MSVGRNELCPCGSGKKYKKCCGVVTPITELRSRHEQKLRKEYAAWIERLNNFVGTHVSNEAVNEARDRFAREIGLSEESVLRPEWTTHFFNWYVIDVRTNGDSLLDSFLKQQGRKMEADLRRAFSQLYVGMYEIVQVEKEVYTVRQLPTGEPRYILRTAGVEAQAGQIIVGRLLNLGLRDMLFSGSIFLQPHVKPALLEWLEDHPEVGEAAAAPDKRTYTTDLYRFIVELGDSTGNTQGDGMVRRIYRDVDLSRLSQTIESHRAFELKKRDGGREIWVYATRKEEHLFPALKDALLELHEVLAEVIVHPDSVVWVEGFPPILDEVTALLQLSDASEQQPIQQLTSTGTRLTKGTLFITSEPTLPPKVLQWAVQTYFTEKWLVTPHDQLDGLAPTLVAASDNPEWREKLLGLIQQLENDSKLGQGLARFMRISILRPRLSLPNEELHISNLLERPMIEGLPESVYTVHPERLADITRFVQEMTEGKSEATVKKYDEVMNCFRSFVRGAFGPSFTWDQLRREDLAYFLVHDIFTRVDTATKTLAANLLSVLLAFFKWLDKQYGMELTGRMQPLFSEWKESLPEAYRLRTVLEKEAHQQLASADSAPQRVMEEPLVLVERNGSGWVAKRRTKETVVLQLGVEAAQMIEPDWIITGLIGQVSDGTWRFYGTPELYPPVVAQMLGVELSVLV